MSEKEKGGRAEGKVLPFVKSEEKETPPAELTLEEQQAVRRQILGLYKEMRAVEGYDVVINTEYARELGLVKKELRAFPEANHLIQEIVQKKLDPNTDAGKLRLCEEWPKDCPPPFVPLPNYWNKFYPGVKYPEWFTEDHSREKQWSFINVQRLFDGKIVSNLTGEGKPFLPRFNEETVFISNRRDEDWDKEENGKKKLQTEAYSDKLLNAILTEAGQSPHVGCVNIKREFIDGLLWKGDPGDRVNSFAAIAVIKKLVGQDFQNWEIRCANQREIEGKHDLATHLDGYFLGDDVAGTPLFRQFVH